MSSSSAQPPRDDVPEMLLFSLDGYRLAMTPEGLAIASEDSRAEPVSLQNLN